MTKIYKDSYEFLHDKMSELLSNGREVKSNNHKNNNTIKEELIELPHQFFAIETPAITFNLESFKAQPWWMVGEILTEFLALNPPLMTRYRPDIIDNSYKLNEFGNVEYVYGQRWHNYNQITNVMNKLKNNPSSKRALITTWVPYDSELERNDVPCNVNYMFLARDNKLDMTATIRSNDIMRGTKYDYTLASFMQQSMASWIGMDVGRLYFHINSLHAYTKDFDKLEQIVKEIENSKQTPISLIVPGNIDSKLYWNDFRHIKKAEEASYNGAWDYFEKNVNDISIPLFRDFSRIYGIKNAKTYQRDDLFEKYKLQIEDSEIRRWL